MRPLHYLPSQGDPAFGFFKLFNPGSAYLVASVPRSFKQKAGFDLERFAKLSQSHGGEVVLICTIGTPMVDRAMPANSLPVMDCAQARMAAVAAWIRLNSGEHLDGA